MRMRWWLRHDKAFHALLGVERFPGEDALRRFFHRFYTQAKTEAFWRPLWKWMLELMEALKLLPAGMRIRCVRVDSAFFDQKLLEFLEELGLSYIVVARLGAPLKGMLSGIQKWTVVEVVYEVSELRIKLVCWNVERRWRFGGITMGGRRWSSESRR